MVISGQHLKKLQDYTNLTLALVNIVITILIPAWKFYVSPEPFAAYYHIDRISLPGHLSPDLNAADYVLQESSTSSPPNLKEEPFSGSSELLTLVIQNLGSTARRNVSINISYVNHFNGVGVRSMPSGIVGVDKWLKPAFQKDLRSLEFQEIPELPVKGFVRLSIWGQFDPLFRGIDIRSSEGMGNVYETALLSGWQLQFISNIWWIGTLFCFALFLFFMKRYENRGKR